MNYFTSLFTGLLVLVSLFFLQTGAVLNSSGWFQKSSSLSVSSQEKIPADLSLAKEHSSSLYGVNSSRNSGNISPESSHELISALKISGMWQAESPTEIAHLVVDSFPSDLAALEVSLRKKVFFTSMLPAVLTVMQEIRTERDTLVEIFEKLGEEPKDLQFADSDNGWYKRLSSDEVYFITGLTAKYRCNNGAELLRRVNVLPVSLVLAQSALESSWGTSRFARLGNNIFGMWTWSKDGIVPLNRPEGMTHRIAEYDSILDSVRAYILTINRLAAYTSLREMRSQTMDPISLSTGLLFYSERREEYVHELQSVINYNGLTDYDRCRLATSQKVSPTVAIRES